MDKNQLYYGDNLTILREMSDECVDLIYLDPPFNSKRNYNVIFRDAKDHESLDQKMVFTDTWSNVDVPDMLFEIAERNEKLYRFLKTLEDLNLDNSTVGYLTTMGIRLIEMHRVLKSTGSLYLHCDPTMSHYLKIVLDMIIGGKYFRNEISWRRSQPKSHTKINFSNCRDVILRYSKSNKSKFYKVYVDYKQDYIDKFYKYIDEDGRRYWLDNLQNPNKDRPNLTYEFLGVKRVWRWTRERMQKSYEEGRVIQRKPGQVPVYKRFLDEMPGKPITDNWDDINSLRASNKETLGYPTQKPFALLERIIKTSSDEDDIILDPFCGCGTALDAAEGLNRKWIGIDITPLAVSLIEKRLKDRYGKSLKPFEVHGFPTTIDSAIQLAHDDKFEFQDWVIEYLLGGVSNPKKTGDAGFDGYSFFRVEKEIVKMIFEVKGGGINKPMFSYFNDAIDTQQAGIGVFVTLKKPTKGMVEYANSCGYFMPEIWQNKIHTFQILTVEDLMNGIRPRIPETEMTHFKKAKKKDLTANQERLFGKT